MEHSGEDIHVHLFDQVVAILPHSPNGLYAQLVLILYRGHSKIQQQKNKIIIKKQQQQKKKTPPKNPPHARIYKHEHEFTCTW